MSEIKHVTVTALTKYIKRKFDVDPHLRDIWVKGELSNVKIHSRGHLYFTLKDEQSRILGVMFSSQNKNMKFRPENGMKVLLRGEISVYEQSGQYQIYAKEMQPDGIGSLYLAYEELKRNLQKEGLFDEKFKKPIPAFPQTIGVVTSPTGAAIRDILITVKRRYPLVKVIILPALVQGVNAGKSVASAIKEANRMGTIDTLIVGRGGGSIEELWAFNEEIVARAIFDSEVPVISAVGHETDYTIADFVSDLRAPTPTGAAELAVPHFADLLEKVSVRKARLMRAIQEKVTKDQERLKSYMRSYAFRYPKQLYEQKEQQLDGLVESLQKEITRTLHLKKDRFQNNERRLQRVHPRTQANAAVQRHEQTVRALTREMSQILAGKQKEFQHSLEKLNALNPLRIMERGYSLVYKEDRLIKSVNGTSEGDKVTVRLQDGTLLCEVMEKVERNDE
ncbi:exodeoxyribonuclease VII large subunit [Bacillus sp. FJAT-42376]|uniref:exodeoxyribonuclease VII large subunit n=1 Tax=Bacillus sp. FJAT-42376 TaxID=2014076 RepID=UPI000F4F81B4|nr:exodeoxyribonuclease VII large subunit [Bacillus sp. FJAT-42376]AZB43528.1 exodeoxyribonuclease VII large subunit [Bacillus sp. FJAT-42376]